MFPSWCGSYPDPKSCENSFSAIYGMCFVGLRFSSSLLFQFQCIRPCLSSVLLHLRLFHADQKSVVFLCTSRVSQARETNTREGLGRVKLGAWVVLATEFTACCFYKYRTFSSCKIQQISKLLALNPVTESNNFYSFSRIRGWSVGFVFTHFYNITFTFYEVSSVSPKRSVTHSNETLRLYRNCVVPCVWEIETRTFVIKQVD